jgi:hypothetical protein
MTRLERQAGLVPRQWASQSSLREFARRFGGWSARGRNRSRKPARALARRAGEEKGTPAFPGPPRIRATTYVWSSPPLTPAKAAIQHCKL